MQRPTPWLMLVVLLLGLLFLREPHLQHADDPFLRWLLQRSRPTVPPVPLTVVEIGANALLDPEAANADVKTNLHAGTAAVSPLELALFLQAALELHPEVVAFENIVKWRARDKDQEQIFLDQAMRVPKLLLAAELSSAPDPDAAGAEIKPFSQVRGRRGDLIEFSGLGRQPGEDMRLISTLSFVNLPDEIANDLRIPLLFLYRGEVIPSFTLQAILLWLRVTPAEVKIEIGSHIALPDGRSIPIGSDGTILIHPNAAKNARRLTLNELLLGIQQREAGTPAGAELADFHDQIVLARTPANPLSPPDVFAATIATIQGNTYLRRITKIFDCAILLLLVAATAYARKLDAADLVLCGIAFTAAYTLIALAVISKWNIWMPACVPIGGVWLLVVAAILFRNRHEPGRPKTVYVPPAIA